MPKDLFSHQSDHYAKYRPHYPAELFEYVMSFVKNRNSSWDCGTGNGQIASVLSHLFKQVKATDISEKQLTNAIEKPNIVYTRCEAEHTPFNEKTFDLVTVGAALHWFDHPKFFEEVKRVLKSGGVFAAWSYALNHVSPEVDAIVSEFYDGLIGPYWDKERKMVDAHYETVHFPFEEMKSRIFHFTTSWSADHYIGYLNTWSSVQKYKDQVGKNPIDQIEDAFRTAWGSEKRNVDFPLFTKLAIVD